GRPKSMPILTPPRGVITRQAAKNIETARRRPGPGDFDVSDGPSRAIGKSRCKLQGICYKNPAFTGGGRLTQGWTSPMNMIAKSALAFLVFALSALVASRADAASMSTYISLGDSIAYGSGTTQD